MVEREPITVIVSQKGWIRALKGHVADLSGVQFKGDDGLKTSFFTETTAKILVVADERQGSSRSMPRSCPAGAASAIRSA